MRMIMMMTLLLLLLPCLFLAIIGFCSSVPRSITLFVPLLFEPLHSQIPMLCAGAEWFIQRVSASPLEPRIIRPRRSALAKGQIGGEPLQVRAFIRVLMLPIREQMGRTDWLTAHNTPEEHTIYDFIDLRCDVVLMGHLWLLPASIHGQACNDCTYR